MPKMSRFLYKDHRGSPTLTLLNVLYVLYVLYVLNVLNMPMDASLACWALFFAKKGIQSQYKSGPSQEHCPKIQYQPVFHLALDEA